MDRQHAVGNINLFHAHLSGTPAQREFHRSVIKNGKKFVALIEDDGFRFIPGHYAVAPADQVEAAEQKQTIAAATVQNRLDELCGSALRQGSPLYDMIDDAYISYCAQSSDVPSIHRQARTYWLLRP